MFVAAGLGQLGHNGQLLSPHFGSRARLQIILTDAKVTHDKPVDYGIHNFCRSCQICVMRCPGRALASQQVWYRGVEKAKMTFERCRPVMTRYSGCGICMKVCPVQRYGMEPVMKHYIETGEVLGKDSDNLEGYSLPDQGYFPPGKLPRFDAEFFDMPRGRSEDRLLAELQTGLAEAKNSNGDDRRALWKEFRIKLEERIERRSDPGGHRDGPGGVALVPTGTSGPPPAGWPRPAGRADRSSPGRRRTRRRISAVPWPTGSPTAHISSPAGGGLRRGGRALDCRLL